jgi:hypothetical protein
MKECACLTCTHHGEDPNCHSTCEAYLEYRREREEFLDKRHKGKMHETVIEIVKHEGIKRMRGKRGRR